MRFHDHYCQATYPAHPLPLRCTLGRNHTGTHTNGPRIWTDEQAEGLRQRAEAAADDAAQTARIAVLNGQRVGPVAIGRNRAEKRRGMGRGR